MADSSFWSRQRILLTGHSGFKGTWLALWLELLGAETFGIALAPDTTPNLFSLVQPFARLRSRLGDIRDQSAVADAVAEARPTIVLHLAAQALVRRAYREPVATFATNVMGTAHLLEAVRQAESAAVVLVVTTDKVYLNSNEGRPFVETDRLGGEDPYSASKASTELLVASWAHSFFASGRPVLATARAGNVVGGSDWSEDRIVPDRWRSAQSGEPVVQRYPEATRPWQHVLDPLAGYLAYLERLDKGDLPRSLNFGPSPADVLAVSEVAASVLAGLGGKAGWVRAAGPQPPEMQHLTLDSTLATSSLGWRPRLPARDALAWTIDWYRRINSGDDPRAVTIDQIQRYQALE